MALGQSGHNRHTAGSIEWKEKIVSPIIAIIPRCRRVDVVAPHFDAQGVARAGIASRRRRQRKLHRLTPWAINGGANFLPNVDPLCRLRAQRADGEIADTTPIVLRPRTNPVYDLPNTFGNRQYLVMVPGPLGKGRYWHANQTAKEHGGQSVFDPAIFHNPSHQRAAPHLRSTRLVAKILPDINNTAKMAQNQKPTGSCWQRLKASRTRMVSPRVKVFTAALRACSDEPVGMDCRVN